uniref:Putative secreted peptide n=1 Tax=Anopheles braziliensis TaxID=58242 RepID=A0A2M3ZUY0_9DIPT
MHVFLFTSRYYMSIVLCNTLDVYATFAMYLFNKNECNLFMIIQKYFLSFFCFNFFIFCFAITIQTLEYNHFFSL